MVLVAKVEGAAGDANFDLLRAVVRTRVAVVARQRNLEPHHRFGMQPRYRRRRAGVSLCDPGPPAAQPLACGELGRVEAGDEVGLIAHGAADRANQAKPRLAPGGRDDDAVDLGALNPVEGGGLVDGVQVAEGDEDESRADPEGESLAAILDEGLFEFQFAGLTFSGEGVLRFELGVEPEVLIVLVAEEEDEAVEVDLALPASFAVRGAREVEFTVAAEGGPLRRLGGRLGGRQDEFLRRDGSSEGCRGEQKRGGDERETHGTSGVIKLLRQHY